MFINIRSAAAFAYDLMVAAVAWFAAYFLRFNFEVPERFLASAQFHAFWVIPLQGLLFWSFGLYRGIWRYASLLDLYRITKAVAFSALVISLALFMLRTEPVVPRSVLIIAPILLMFLMGGGRISYRAWKEHHLSIRSLNATPVLIAGAGSATDLLLRELKRNVTSWHVVGLLDDDRKKIGKQIQGVPVLGPLTELTPWADKLEVKEIILAMPAAPLAARRQLSEQCTNAGLRLLTVPSLEDLMQGRVAVSQLRPIGLDDLLGREPVQLDESGLHALLTGKTVLVSGAGGSIGSELCRQIARFTPERMIFFDSSELALYTLDQEFRLHNPRQEYVCLVGDVKDAARIGEVMTQYRPAVVFHAAAYKHVPLMEVGNALQALKNNVLGTYVCARAARQSGVEKFVLVSTDKAVNPTNVMGASKRLAEMVCQALQEGDGTRFVAVRFGNVLGSSGSVIPKFQEQIAKGGPITVTHPEINRYFMSIPEAAQLVLQAGLMGQGGEIYVLDMGDPVKIADLARLMIRLSGHTETEIEIVYTGLRPGEKLYEELLADTETTLPTPNPKLRVAQARKVSQQRIKGILTWIESQPGADDDEVRAQLREWLPEYGLTTGDRA